MKLSIIMPCFNVSESLARALDSIIMQEVNFNYEVIIIDDASTDKTVEIAKDYSIRYPQINIICNKNNKGNAYTYYVGLCAAKGDYFCVLDGDDYYTIPDKLQRQVDFLDSDIEEEYVGTCTQYIMDLGNNKVSIPPRSNFRWMTYADFLTEKTAYYHTSTYMYRNIFRGNVPEQMSEELYRGDTPRTMFHLAYSGKKIRILDFVGSAYTYKLHGLWSGLKEKEQYEYRISYLTQHKENVATNFERLCTDKQIKACRHKMETVSDDFRKFPTMTIDEALQSISKYAGIFAFAQTDFVLQHAYVSSYMDTLCASLGFVDSIQNPQHIQTEKNSQHICIVIGILNPHGGGIFEEIRELINIFNNKKIYLMVTEMDEIPEHVIDNLKQYTNLTILCPPNLCTERLGWFREQFVRVAPFRTYFYCSHKDAYGVALAQMGCCENITLFSFDHGYICGVLNPNLDKIIAKRPTDYWMLKKHLKEKVIFIPAWSHNDNLCKNINYSPFKNHDKLITASGAARFYKVNGRPPYRYIDIIILLLKNINSIHYHFGELPENVKEELNKKMKLEGIEQNHFIHIPWAEDLPLTLLNNHVDIFIEPFPVVSYKMTLEVLSVGIPVIAHKGLMRMNITDFLPKGAMFWDNQKDLLATLSNLTKEFLLKQSSNTLKYFNEYHNIKKVRKLLQENISFPEPKKLYYPDDTLIDITTSFQLFGNGYGISIIDSYLPRGEYAERKSQKINSIDNSDHKFIINAVEKTLKRNSIAHLDYHIVEHCNLNCVGCSTFAPIADSGFVDLDIFERDMKNLYKLVGNAVQQIHLLGGEPLLHPEVEQFAKICRAIFQNTRIDITTNGLRIFEMPNTFWSVLKENNIAIKYTQYPIKFDYHKMVEYIKEKGVYVFSAGPADGIKYFRRIPLNVKGTFNMYHSFIKCPYTDCTQLRDGKLYHCPASAFSYLLNQKMNKDNILTKSFHISNKDYIDINTAESCEEVYQFLSSAVPFCQYCDMDNINDSIEWKTSKKDIREWVDI